MARSWLTSHLLPSKFWWWSLKRATELSNYLPVKIDNTLTTPHEQVYNIKPDYRNILPQFSIAYLNRIRDGDTDRRSTDSHTIRAVLIGRDPKSAAFQFYHPGTKKTLTSDSFTIDDTLPSGPTFGLTYDGGLYFNRHSDFNDNLRPPTFKPDQLVYMTALNPILPATIVTTPVSNINPIYTVQLPDKSLHQFTEDMISDTNPSIKIEDNNPPTNLFPKWIKILCRTTLFTNEIQTPLKGYLRFLNNEWYIKSHKKNDNTTIKIDDFYTKARQLCETVQLFPGHPRFKTITKLRQAYAFSHIIAKHVSARGLSTEDVPTLLHHHKLNPSDKKNWDDAYAEEYFGLTGLPCWVTISHDEFLKNRHLYKSILPSMATSLIKYDEYGKPKRAKYRIVAFGNLESHKWEKDECFAPVLSTLELRLLTALAVKHKRVLKNADVKQVFVQAILPPEESYILKPPVGCPHTPPNSYWKLIRTIYGLRRSPKHWFDKATTILTDIGLTPCPKYPCIFHGKLLPNKSPLYLGIYVDDIIYFSADDSVEKEFETRLQSKVNTDFMGKVSHYLGIRFQWKQTPEQVSVHLSQEAFF